MQAFIRYVLTSGEKGTANSANSIQEVFRKYKLCAKKKKKKCYKPKDATKRKL